MSFAVGSAIAPVLGGKLNDVFGYRQTCDLIAMTSMFIAFINFGVVFLPSMISHRAIVDEKEAARIIS